MAEEKHESNAWEPVIIIVCMLVFLVALAWVRGGLQNINSQGFFVAPPSIAPEQTGQTNLPPPSPKTQPAT